MNAFMNSMDIHWVPSTYHAKHCVPGIFQWTNYQQKLTFTSLTFQYQGTDNKNNHNTRSEILYYRKVVKSVWWKYIKAYEWGKISVLKKIQEKIQQNVNKGLKKETNILKKNI